MTTTYRDSLVQRGDLTSVEGRALDTGVGHAADDVLVVALGHRVLLGQAPQPAGGEGERPVVIPSSSVQHVTATVVRIDFGADHTMEEKSGTRAYRESKGGICANLGRPTLRPRTRRGQVTHLFLPFFSLRCCFAGFLLITFPDPVTLKRCVAREK